MSHHRSTSHSFFPECSGLCLFITVYVSLFLIAGVILFSSVSQIRKSSSFPEKHDYSNYPFRQSSSFSGYYYTHNINDYEMQSTLHDNNTTKFSGMGIDERTLFPRVSTIGLRWPYSDFAVNCSSLQEVTDLEFIAAGWTKAVYKGKFRGKSVAIKTVNLNGHDIQECQKKPGSTLSMCYRKAAAKIIKEVILLTELAHDNVIKVLGSCVPDAVGPVSLVTELGDPLDTVRLLQLSWEERLRLALGIAQILYHLAHSPLGSLSMNDFRRQQFVLVNGVLKLSDVDDLGIGEPSCDTDEECSKISTRTLIKSNNTINETVHFRLPHCYQAQCQGHNEQLNIWHAGQHFIRLLLPISAPTSLEPHIQELLAAYNFELGKKSLCDTLCILQTTERLVKRYISGEYITTSVGIDSLGFEKLEDSDLPGMFDYQCRHSMSAVSCVMSVFNEIEAAQLCAQDADCKAVVLGQEQTWTGRTIAILKNGFCPPSMKKGFSLLLKRIS